MCIAHIACESSIIHHISAIHFRCGPRTLPFYLIPSVVTSRILLSTCVEATGVDRKRQCALGNLGSIRESKLLEWPMMLPASSLSDPYVMYMCVPYGDAVTCRRLHYISTFMRVLCQIICSLPSLGLPWEHRTHDQNT
ncbi:unnamed protein product [Mycena citricolor]|uniref:Uncharacterized protein n=1 Tax=Mycena citricolor TaxID=2018698 RepID=A0AAD2GWR2_9AGAR|nr:unnamed protein product [Mycena citricolor]